LCLNGQTRHLQFGERLAAALGPLDWGLFDIASGHCAVAFISDWSRGMDCGATEFSPAPTDSNEQKDMVSRLSKSSRPIPKRIHRPAFVVENRTIL
jgi:hypothetical protein